MVKKKSIQSVGYKHKELQYIMIQKKPLKPQPGQFQPRHYQQFKYLMCLYKDSLFMFSQQEFANTFLLVDQKIGISAQNKNQQLPSIDQTEAYEKLIQLSQIQKSIDYFTKLIESQPTNRSYLLIFFFLTIMKQQLDRINLKQAGKDQKNNLSDEELVYYKNILVEEFLYHKIYQKIQKKNAFIKMLQKCDYKPKLQDYYKNYLQALNLIKQSNKPEAIKKCKINSENHKGFIVQLMTAKMHASYEKQRWQHLKKYRKFSQRNIKADEFAANLYKQNEDYVQSLKLFQKIMMWIIVNEFQITKMQEQIQNNKLQMLINQKRQKIAQFKKKIKQNINQCGQCITDSTDTNSQTIIKYIQQIIQHHSHCNISFRLKFLKRIYDQMKGYFKLMASKFICKKIFQYANKIQQEISAKNQQICDQSLIQIIQQFKSILQQLQLGEIKVQEQSKNPAQNQQICDQSLQLQFGQEISEIQPQGIEQSYNQLSQYQISKYFGQQKRTKKLFNRLDDIKEIVGLMNFYWYDQQQNVKKVVQGTGFLIHQQFVITARHNFYQKSDPNLICDSCTIKFRNKNDQILQYRSKPSKQWFQSNEWDLGAVFLQKPVAHFKNNIKFVARKDYIEAQQKDQLLLPGFSLEYRTSDKEDQMKVLNPIFMSINGFHCEYKADTVSGLSGSPVFYKAQNEFIYVLSMHLSRRVPKTQCRALLFTQKIANQVYYWIQTKFYQQKSINNMVNKLKQEIMTSMGKNIQNFKQDVITVYKEANIQKLFEIYEQIIVQNQYSVQIIREITAKMKKIGQKQNIGKFYNELYAKTKRQSFKQELKRLNLNVNVNVVLIEEDKKRSQPSVDSQIQVNQSPQVQKSNSNFVLSQSQYSLIQLEEIQKNISFQQSYCQLSLVEDNPLTQFNVIYDRKNKTNYLCNVYLSLKQKNHLNIIKFLQKNNKFLKHVPQYFVKNARKDGFTYLTQKGFQYSCWPKQLNQAIVLKLFKSICQGLIQLDQLGVFHLDLNLRNIVLFVNEKDYNYSNINANSLMSHFDKINFKIIDFQYAFLLKDDSGRQLSKKIMQSAKQLYETQSDELNSEPITQCIRSIQKLNGKFNEGSKNSLNTYLKQIRQQFIINAINKYKPNNQFQSLYKKLQKLQQYANDSKYKEMIKYIDTCLKQNVPEKSE